MSPHPARFWRLRKSSRVESVVVFHFVTSDTRQSGPGGWHCHDQMMKVWHSTVSQKTSPNTEQFPAYGDRLIMCWEKSRFERCRQSWRIPRHAGWNKSPCCMYEWEGAKRSCDSPLILLLLLFLFSIYPSSLSWIMHFGPFSWGEGTEESLRTVLFWHM